MRKAYSQGLSNCCGIYSILNAYALIHNSSVTKNQELYIDIVKFLNKKGLLESYLVEGMLFKDIKLILQQVVKNRIPHQKFPFAGKPTPSLDVFWEDILLFLKPGRRRAVITGVEKDTWGHWTVVKSISDKQMRLFDSDIRKCLNKINCTTGDSDGKRHLMLFPAQTIFLGTD